MPDAEIMRVCNTINVFSKYNWYLDLMDDETAVYLGLQNIKKYWRRMA